MALPNKKTVNQAVTRVRLLYGGLVLILGIFGVRLFYIQVISYQHYHKAALSDQLKQYQIPASRGLIEAYEGGNIVPIVLNQERYTLYVDPTLVKKPEQTASKLSPIIGGSADSYVSLIKTKDTRYVILAKQLSQTQSSKILALKLPGVGTQGQDYRTYPDQTLASQVLGFVNNNGVGEYGVEQALNQELSGKAGQVKAVTDVNGVPLAATKGNIEKAPQNGKNVVLTLDTAMQSHMEQILAQEYKSTKSQGISAVIINPDNGQIKAMANYPTYNPANYQKVTNTSLFENGAVTNAIEPGSSMKTLTTSAALDQGVIQPNSTFYDPATWNVDGFNITDIEQDGGARAQSISSILSLSLNTGATWELMQMSQPGGTTINQKGISAWHDYMVNHFQLGKPTNVEQGYESNGYVPTDNPKGNPSIALTYAETAFGQGVQVTALQMASALSSVIDGGTYYQPTLVSETINSDGQATANKPKVVDPHTVSPKIGPELEPLMENVVTTYLHEGFGYMSFPGNYMVGGKTGTAQIAQPGGGYYADKYNGTYVGFVGGDKAQYVIVVFNIEPNVTGYAGSYGGQPVFADLAHMLINDGYVTPKSQ